MAVQLFGAFTLSQIGKTEAVTEAFTAREFQVIVDS